MSQWYESQDELKRLYDEGKTTVYAYKTVWQVFYSQAQRRYYRQAIRRSGTPYTIKGRILATSDRI